MSGGIDDGLMNLSVELTFMVGSCCGRCRACVFSSGSVYSIPYTVEEAHRTLLVGWLSEVGSIL
jgi:hypothetical protein